MASLLVSLLIELNDALPDIFTFARLIVIDTSPSTVEPDTSSYESFSKRNIALAPEYQIDTN